MVEDSDGNLWIGTEGSGILRFDRRTQRLRQFAGPQSGVAAVSSPYVSAVYIDRVNRLWAGTLNGLDRIDMLTGRRTRYAEDDGLASTKVACILEHAGGDLWLSTDKGISKFNPRTGVFQNFSVADGVPGDLTGYSACVKGANGEMFFGGFAGATRFRPDQVSTDSYSPPAVLTAFDLFGAPVSIRPGSPLQQVIGFTKELALAHNQNSFSFQFAALSFRSPSTSRYRYKLEGLEQSWHEVGGDRRYAAYTSLPAGTYRFQRPRRNESRAVERAGRGGQYCNQPCVVGHVVVPNALGVGGAARDPVVVFSACASAPPPVCSSTQGARKRENARRA